MNRRFNAEMYWRKKLRHSNYQVRSAATTRTASGKVVDLGGIAAEIGDETGDIEATYDRVTNERLLNFAPKNGGIIVPVQPAPDRRPSMARGLRDFPITFGPGGSSSDHPTISEKLVAWAVIRDLMGFPLAKLRIVDGVGRGTSRGRFVRPVSALRVALSGAAWSARNGISPSIEDLRIARNILHDYPNLRQLAGGHVLTVEDALKLELSEVVRLLNRHSAFIRNFGRHFCEDPYIHNALLFGFVHDEMLAAHAKWPEDYQMNCSCPYSLSGA